MKNVHLSPILEIIIFIQTFFSSFSCEENKEKNYSNRIRVVERRR
jgi:hypothetical protein